MNENTIKDGYEAIQKIRSSQSRLSELVEEFEHVNEELVAFKKAGEKLRAEQKKFEDAASKIQETADELRQKQDALQQGLETLPEIVRLAVSEAVQREWVAAEGRLMDRVRDELKDTRSSLRDTVLNGTASFDKKISDVFDKIISEMPRTIFGKRGG